MGTSSERPDFKRERNPTARDVGGAPVNNRSLRTSPVTLSSLDERIPRISSREYCARCQWNFDGLAPEIIGKLVWEPGFGHFESKAILSVFQDRLNAQSRVALEGGAGTSGSLYGRPRMASNQRMGYVCLLWSRTRCENRLGRDIDRLRLSFGGSLWLCH